MNLEARAFRTMTAMFLIFSVALAACAPKSNATPETLIANSTPTSSPTPNPALLDFRSVLDCKPIEQSAWQTAQERFGDPRVMEDWTYVVLNYNGTFRATIKPSKWDKKSTDANSTAARQTNSKMFVCADPVEEGISK